jgi:mannose-1-phosphate guanylyltransferase
MRPKQLMRLFDGKSPLQLARERLSGLFEPSNIWVITSEHYLDLVEQELGDVPRANLIGEPMGRDTANAIGLAAEILARRDEDATMAVFTADHLISPQDRFAAAIGRGLDAAAAQPEALVTFGITPKEPHTGYGYLHRGEELSPGVYRVAEFKEKPDEAPAEEYVSSGDYYWNSGMFAWRVAAIQAEIERHLPQNARLLREMAADWDDIAGKPAAAERFEKLEKISIDFGVMEKAADVLVVEMDCDWLDLGSWNAIGQTRAADEAGNVAIAERVLVHAARNNVLVSETPHMLVALGVEDLVVVHSEDATLVCHRDHVQQIKELVAQRRAQFGEMFE